MQNNETAMLEALENQISEWFRDDKIDCLRINVEQMAQQLMMVALSTLPTMTEGEIERFIAPLITMAEAEEKEGDPSTLGITRIGCISHRIARALIARLPHIVKEK